MLVDYQQLNEELTITAATTYDTNVVQMGSAGKGTGSMYVPVSVVVSEVFAGGTSITVEVLTDSTDAMGSPTTIESSSWALATLDAVGVVVLDKKLKIREPFAMVRVTGVGVHTAGKVLVRLGVTEQDGD